MINSIKKKSTKLMCSRREGREGRGDEVNCFVIYYVFPPFESEDVA